MKTFESNGYKYVIDDFGIINQVDPEPFCYDVNYVSTYDSEAYKKGNEILQSLRLGFVIGSHGSVPDSIQDNGYGNGAFMKFASQLIRTVKGKDVTGVLVEGCEIVNDHHPADVYTFWDCLEHIEDVSFLRTLPCKTVCISLPWCHFHTAGINWFNEKYKHRKPNEHLRHFYSGSLRRLMSNYGWRNIATSNHEDIIRKSEHGFFNILSMSFQRK